MGIDPPPRGVPFHLHHPLFPKDGRRHPTPPRRRQHVYPALPQGRGNPRDVRRAHGVNEMELPSAAALLLRVGRHAVSRPIHAPPVGILSQSTLNLFLGGWEEAYNFETLSPAFKGQQSQASCLQQLTGWRTRSLEREN